ncbi:acyltransferase family protein [Streptomonospora nanhaiensis]|uniref:acyltransferase family protein n=1 Tax=Streptomonospora nanhaiensis TaxID=1323731 RepID=UPI001C38F51F|nr:acyltransferase family protein [Streptomonospora nanhaiensis]MBV2362315.1 acyltransferase [Streptomonospora nanhaiensis]
MSAPASAAPAAPPADGTPAAPGAPGARPAGYRPEIQGLRAVAVLLVAAYHIWFGRVSGGVDVFLLLTGFLITGSLVRGAERDGAVRFVPFLTRLVRRLVPPAAVVLGAVLAASAVWLPASQWQEVADQTVAAALYHENWRLALNAVDYMERDGAVSPLQHFWSLSIQGQFYLVWAVLIALAAAAARLLGAPVRAAAAAALAAVFAASLAYSVHATAADQAWAYFDTGARLWEFALGGLLALALPLLRLPAGPRAALGWAGLAGLVLCGALVDVSTLFPGYIALWPTGAAVLVVLGGGSGRAWGADALLGGRVLTWVGDHAYALYLWHWPVLVCYREISGSELPGVLGGLLVLAVSAALAALTKALVQDGTTALGRVRGGRAWPLAVAAVALVPVLAAASMWSAGLEEQRQRRQDLATDQIAYPGARALVDPRIDAAKPDVPVLPAPADAKDDQNQAFQDGCHAGLDDAEAIVCEYGSASPARTIALVGASRTAHWFPALMGAAENNDWKVVSLTKSGCQFSTDPPTRDGRPFPECERWREGAMDHLERLRPDAVLTSSTRATSAGERVHPGFVERWRQLDALGIEVVGIRDLPRLDYSGAECVEENGPAECVSPESFSHAPSDPAPQVSGIPDNVHLIDLTEYVCPSGRCPAVIGNVLVYWDHSHLTATYSATLALMLEARLKSATGW